MPKISTTFRNINVISKRDVPVMQEILRKHYFMPEEDSLRLFQEKSEYENFLRNIDLPVFLGAPSYQKIVCPFCGKPEGYISYYDDEERWTYRCFAEKKSYNIISLVQNLANCRYSQALTYIDRVYNIAYADDSYLNRTIAENIAVLSEDTFAMQYPYTVQFLKSYFPLLKVFYRAIQQLHNQSVHSNDGDELILLTVAETCQILGVYDRKARTFLRWLTLLGYIDAVQKDTLCNSDIARLERISYNGRHEFASVYRIKPLNKELLTVCEETAVDLLSLRLTKGNMTLKTVRAITSGHSEDYSIVSPNFSAWKRYIANSAAEEAILLYSRILRQELARNKYILEKNVVSSIPVMCRMPNGRESKVDVAWKEVRSAVLEINDMKCVPANQDVLQRLGVENKKLSGNIIVPSDAVYSVEQSIGLVLNEIAEKGYAMLADHIPSAKGNRKLFRDMLTACGIKSVRLNDAYRKKYGICCEKGCTNILIDATPQ